MAVSKVKTHRRVESKSLGKYIESDPTVCGGEPVIKGTRVRVRDILELLADGHRLEDIPGSFPRVSPEAAVEAVQFASEVLGKRHRTPQR